jgi:macrolide transport system ATP-binding/permease protein
VIEIKNIFKTYRMGDNVLNALDDVSLTIEAGEFVAIMGPSGSGKSTLMNVLGLLDAPTSGSYRLDGDEISQLSEDEKANLRSRRIGFIFQQFNLLARTSAELNVGLPLIYDVGRHDRERALALLRQVGMGERSQHSPSELSGGQQQRVAIARALVNAPQILFADEPTGSLDSASEREVLILLQRLNEAGITVIIVTHEPEIASHVKRIIRMRDGKIQSDEINRAFVSVISGTPGGAPKSADFAMDVIKTRPVGSAFKLVNQVSAYVRQALRSLIANKVRSVLSMLGILIGVAAVIAMIALGKGASKSMEAQLSSLGSNLLTLRTGSLRAGGVAMGVGTTSRLTLSDLEEIRRLSGVQFASANVNGRVQVAAESRNWNTSVVGTTTAYQKIKSNTAGVGRFFTDAEDRARARVAVLGKTVATELFGDRNPVGESIKVNRIVFQVVGILGEKGASGFGDQDDIVVVPINTAMRRLLGKQYVDSIDIQVTDMPRMDDVESAVKTLINERHRIREEYSDTAFSIRNMAEIQEALSSVSRVMAMLLAVIASISLLVGGIGIMNIMLVTVTERTREIGLRKAVGATRTSIMTQFLVESMCISLVGGAIGIGVGVGLAQALSYFAGWSVLVTWDSVLLSAGFSVGIGIAFGLWPARAASRLHPIEALRHE